MALDPTFQAALGADVVHAFTAVQIAHPVKTIRLIDGQGFLVIGGQTFVGHDDDIGSLDAISVDDEKAGNESPEAYIDILPVNLTIGGVYGMATAQGSVINIWSGAYDPATGAVIGTPDLRFVGRLDTIDWETAAAGSGKTVLRIVATSAFDIFFDVDEGARLSDAFHRSIWPGEEGFEYMTTILDNMPWGTEGPRPQVVVTSHHPMINRVINKAANR